MSDAGRARYIYLGGAIAGLPEQEAEGWRDEITPDLEAAGWQVVNPCDLPISRVPRETCEGDLHAIVRCDVYLARIETPSWGTAMEIFFSRNHCIPVIAWVPVQFAASAKLVSPWIQTYANRIFQERHSVFEYLRTL